MLKSNFIFLRYANGYGVGNVKKHKCSRYKNFNSIKNISGKDHALFRTIEGRSHILFVLDIDEPMLNTSLKVAKFVNKISPGLVKFSGGRGFHFIQRIDDTCVRVKKICNDKGIRLHTFIRNVLYNLEDYVKKKLNIRKDLELFDKTMAERNRLIRSFSLHSRTKRYSIPISMDWDLNKILDVSKELKFVNRFRMIPKFGLTRFFFSDKNDRILKKYRVRRINRKFVFPNKNVKIDDVKLPLCLSCIENYKEPPHKLRFLLVTYLLHTYFLDDKNGRSRCHGFIKRLKSDGHWEDYNPVRTSYQINQIYDNKYIMSNCKNIQYSGFCNDETMKKCPCELGDNPIKFYQRENM